MGWSENYNPTIPVHPPEDAPLDTCVLGYWGAKGWLFCRRKIVGLSTSWFVDDEVTSPPRHWIHEK